MVFVEHTPFCFLLNAHPLFCWAHHFVFLLSTILFFVGNTPFLFCVEGTHFCFVECIHFFLTSASIFLFLERMRFSFCWMCTFLFLVECTHFFFCWIQQNLGHALATEFVRLQESPSIFFALNWATFFPLQEKAQNFLCIESSDIFCPTNTRGNKCCVR